jgi:hypothetical protein
LQSRGPRLKFPSILPGSRRRIHDPMRLLLAFACFFRLLFTGRLPARAASFLPPGAAPEPPAPAPTPPPAAAPAPAPAPTPAAKKLDPAPHHRDGALALLGLLQREGRLVDFLREGLDGHADADIGVAVRDIHRGCKKVLDDHFAMEPVMPGEEEARVKVPAGFDPGEVRLIGEVRGAPPFAGTLRHHGWRVTEVKLPSLVEGVDRRVVAPAEVEVA